MSETPLSRRERQIVDALYRLESGSVQDVVDALPDPPSYSSVRTLLRVLESKGHVKHVKSGARYIYSPTLPRGEAASSALRRVVDTFCSGSLSGAFARLLEVADTELDESELDRLSDVIEQARKERTGD